MPTYSTWNSLGSDISTSEIQDGAVTYAKLNATGSASWILVETQTLAGAATTVDFATAVAGNTDYAYMIEGYIVNTAGAQTQIGLRLNGASIVGSRQVMYADNNVVGASRDATVAAMGIATNGKKAYIRYIIPMSKANLKRIAEFYYCQDADGSNVMGQGNVGLTTPADATEITSLGVVVTVANALGIGTILNLYKRAV